MGAAEPPGSGKANGKAAPRGMFGREDVCSQDRSRHASFLTRDAPLMAQLERAAYELVVQCVVGAPPPASDPLAAREPSLRAFAAVKSPNRKMSWGAGGAAQGQQQPGDPPSGGMQRVFHAAQVAHALERDGKVPDELMVSTYICGLPLSPDPSAATGLPP